MPALPPPEKPVAVLIRRKAEQGHVVKQARRVISNHDEVLKEVEAVGWSVVVHDASVQDVSTQCMMFHEADLIIGPHGAGLVNMLCSCPGTVILEICQSDGFNQSFLRLAAALGLRYIG